MYSISNNSDFSIYRLSSYNRTVLTDKKVRHNINSSADVSAQHIIQDQIA
jgi:hypothetical protein